MADFYRKKTAEEDFHKIVAEGEIRIAVLPFQLMDCAPLTDLLLSGIVPARMGLLSAIPGGFHFHEDKTGAVAHQEINLGGMQLEIPRQKLEAPAFQKAAGETFPRPSEPQMLRLFFLRHSSAFRSAVQTTRRNLRGFPPDDGTRRTPEPANPQSDFRCGECRTRVRLPARCAVPRGPCCV